MPTMKNREKTASRESITRCPMPATNNRSKIMRRLDLDASISRSWRVMLVIVALRRSYVSTTSHHLKSCCWQVNAFNTFAKSYNIRVQLEENKLLMTSRRSMASSSARLFAHQLDDIIDSSTQRETEPIMSEVDAIKILRAYPRPTTKLSKHLDQSGSLIACNSAGDVLQILHQSSTLLNPSQVSSGDKSVENVVNAISSNVAAAALRRLLSPPFLPVSFSTTKKGIQYLSKQPVHQNEASKSERELYIELKTCLQQKLRDSIEEQIESLLHLTNNDTDSTPKLLPKTSTLDNPPGYSTSENKQTLNWYAFADILFSTSVLTNVQIYQLTKSNRSSRNVYLQSIVETQSPSNNNEYSIEMDIFDKVTLYLSRKNEITSSFVRSIGQRRIVRDVLIPIVVVEAAKKQQGLHADDIDGVCDVNDSRSSSARLNLNHILQVSTLYMSSPHSLDFLNCADLSTTLWCFAQIYSDSKSGYDWFDEQCHPFQIGEDQINLIRLFMKRLRKKNIHSKGSGKDLARAMWAADRLVMLSRQLSFSDELAQSWEMSEIELPDDLFPGESDLSEKDTVGLFDGTNGAQSEVDEHLTTQVVDQVREEAVIMFYTLTKELLKTYSNSPSHCKLKYLSLEQLADILQAGISLKIPRSDLSMLAAAAVSLLKSHGGTCRSNDIINRCNSCGQISRLLWAFQRLRVSSDDFVGCGADSTSSAIQLLGERFLALVREQDTYHQKCTPKELAIALRSAVMMFPGRSAATKPILEAASQLILDGPEDNDVNTMIEPYFFDSPSFLMECSEYELSNFLFAFAKAKSFDEALLKELTAQMLEADVIESCSASSASRAMWSCAVLLQHIPLDSDESFLHERQVDLYHQLSGILLSSQLTPTDCSCAMWAMAKSGYALDKGCFDYLASTLARMLETSSVSTRYVSQALWACGKMIRYEQQVVVHKSNSQSSYKQTPYMESVETFLRYLIKNSDQMTPLHISQAIWAMGSLRVFEPIIAEELTYIALKNSLCFNSQDISNIVWGLSKIEFNKPELILRLVNRVTESELIDLCTSQEASNLMYALGKLGVRDENVFAQLSKVLMSKLHDASSQAIANALWAFDAVELEPPIELMGSWAREKLGMQDVA